MVGGLRLSSTAEMGMETDTRYYSLVSLSVSVARIVNQPPACVVSPRSVTLVDPTRPNILHPNPADGVPDFSAPFPSIVPEPVMLTLLTESP